MRQIIWRVMATETGAVLSAISRASAPGGRQQFVRRVQRAHQALLLGLGGREHAAGVAPLQRRLDAHQVRQEPGRGRPPG